MGIRLKFWFYLNYWWLLMLALIGLCALAAFLQHDFDFKLLAALLASFLSLIYFLQKQRLEETKLFREIFAECNKRYDKLNDSLNSIFDKPHETPLEPPERAKLNDYFNLCGEEYLYFALGYIFPSVWKAWYNGMIYFMKNPRIKAMWDEEKESDSYYGLSFPQVKSCDQQPISCLPSQGKR